MATDGAPTMSGMMNTMNAALGPSGASVELQSKVKDDVYQPTKRTELDDIDSKMRIAAAARAVSALDEVEALKWAVEKKDEGNRLFASKYFVNACEMYLQAMVALRPVDEEDEEPQETKDGGEQAPPQCSPLARRSVMLPVLCNLAACKLALKDHKAASDLCSLALSVDATCFKALMRRSKAYAMMGKATSAAADRDTAAGVVSKAEAAGSPTEVLPELKETHGIPVPPPLPVDKMKKLLTGLDKDLRRITTERQRVIEEEKRLWAGVTKGLLYADKPTHKATPSSASSSTAAAAAAAPTATTPSSPSTQHKPTWEQAWAPTWFSVMLDWVCCRSRLKPYQKPKSE